ncbi:hypothetical protein H2201_009145, partial [Coniosporium apollinis]
IIASTPFKFLVGQDRKLFTVHAALVAHHSKSLSVLVDGHMLEAKEGCVLLEDVDEYTFVRFSQYAYTGDYIAADPDTVLDSSIIATTSSAPDDAAHNQADLDVAVPHPDPENLAELTPVADGQLDDPWSWGVTKKDKKKGKKGRVYLFDEAAESLKDAGPASKTVRSKRLELWDDFRGKSYAISAPSFQPRRNSETCEDYTEVFLCHARLYVFADKYDIDTLKRLSLHKLQRTLAIFTLYNERVGDVVELMRYSYSNTADRSGTIDDLRLLVVHYAACVVEDLIQSAQFQSLLADIGQLARDLVGQMLKRLD